VACAPVDTPTPRAHTASLSIPPVAVPCDETARRGYHSYRVRRDGSAGVKLNVRLAFPRSTFHRPSAERAERHSSEGNQERQRRMMNESRQNN
jgi:hypothetical protein